MSRRWQGFHSTRSAPEEHVEMATDLANQYANQLELYHITFQQKPSFCLEVLGYSKATSDASVDSLLPSFNSQSSVSRIEPHSTRQHFTPSGQQPLTQSRGTWSQDPSRHFHSASFSSSQIENTSPQMPINTFSNPSLHGGSWQDPPTSYATAQNTSNLRNFAAGTPTSFNYAPDAAVDDELTAMSDMLLGQQFLEMDRVITFDGTNFALDMNGWHNGDEV